jgi:hypothetical protein
MGEQGNREGYPYGCFLTFYPRQGLYMDVLVDLIPLMVGAALAPIYPIIVLLLLQGDGGLGKALAFVAGAIVVRVVQGIVFGFVFSPAVTAESAARLALIGPTLLTLIGILLLVAAFKKWRKEEDLDAPPPAWMSTLSGLSVVKAAGAGALFVAVAVKQWVFTLAAIAVIEEAQPGLSMGVTLYLVFLLVTQTPVLLPLLAFAVAPARSARPLAAAHGWLVRHNRVIVMFASLVFGLWFLYKGVSGLLILD